MVDLMLQAACLASPVTFWKHFTLCCPGLYSVQVWLVYKCLALQMSSILIGLSTFLRRPHCEHIGHFWMCPTWRKWPIAKSWQSAYTLCKKDRDAMAVEAIPVFLGTDVSAWVSISSMMLAPWKPNLQSGSRTSLQYASITWKWDWKWAEARTAPLLFLSYQL